MASIGSVKSPALSGEAAPVFKAADRRKVVAEVTDVIQEDNAKLTKEVADLTALVKQLLAQGAAPKEVTPEAEELTPAEKSAKTKAENKAKAEADKE